MPTKTSTVKPQKTTRVNLRTVIGVVNELLLRGSGSMTIVRKEGHSVFAALTDLGYDYESCAERLVDIYGLEIYGMRTNPRDRGDTEVSLTLTGTLFGAQPDEHLLVDVELTVPNFVMGESYVTDEGYRTAQITLTRDAYA